MSDQPESGQQAHTMEKDEIVETILSAKKKFCLCDMGDGKVKLIWSGGSSQEIIGMLYEVIMHNPKAFMQTVIDSMKHISKQQSKITGPPPFPTFGTGGTEPSA